MNVRVLKSTNKRLGADARIAHYGPASTYANYRGRIYVRSRAMSDINRVLAKRRSPYTDVSGNYWLRRKELWTSTSWLLPVADLVTRLHWLGVLDIRHFRREFGDLRLRPKMDFP